jgi:DNA-binding CsgD family transcriptional regulator
VSATPHPQSALGQAALAWLNIDRSARLIIDRDHKVRWRNHSADALLDGETGVELRGGALATTDPANQTALRDLVKRSETGPRSLCLVRPEMDDWLLIDCVGMDWGEALFCLCLTIAGSAHRHCYRHLDEAFQLTPAEHRVLQDLLAGNEAEMLSAQHDVSIETTRSHIKSIYAKVGVNSRERLFARLQGFRI